MAQRIPRQSTSWASPSQPATTSKLAAALLLPMTSMANRSSRQLARMDRSSPRHDIPDSDEFVRQLYLSVLQLSARDGTSELQVTPTTLKRILQGRCWMTAEMALYFRGALANRPLQLRPGWGGGSDQLLQKPSQPAGPVNIIPLAPYLRR